MISKSATYTQINAQQSSTIITVLQHHPAEGVGEIGLWAHARGIQLQVFRADLGELPPVSARPVLLLGGPYPLKNGPLWLEVERTWLSKALAMQAPVFGICLGAQLLSIALGSEVSMMATPEEGWNTVFFPDGSTLDVLQCHDDQFSLPPETTQMASSALCCQQGYTSETSTSDAWPGKYVGTQFHPEWNADLVTSLNSFFGTSSPLPKMLGTLDHERFDRVAQWFWPMLDAWFAQSRREPMESTT